MCCGSAAHNGKCYTDDKDWEKMISKANRARKIKRTAKPSERWEGAFWQNKQRATNSITFLISGTTSTYGRRKGTRTNLTDTTMQTNTHPLESRSDAVDAGWIFVCREPVLPAHGLINCNCADNCRPAGRQSEANSQWTPLITSDRRIVSLF